MIPFILDSKLLCLSKKKQDSVFLLCVIVPREKHLNHQVRLAYHLEIGFVQEKPDLCISAFNDGHISYSFILVQVSLQPANVMDLFTTSLALASISPPNDQMLDGLDLTSVLLNGSLQLNNR